MDPVSPQPHSPDPSLLGCEFNEPCSQVAVRLIPRPRLNTLVEPGPDGKPRWSAEALRLIPLSELTKLIEPGPRGKPRHVSALYRYLKRGVGGIRLEGWKLPEGFHASLAGWYTFLSKLTTAHLDESRPGLGTRPRVSADKARSVEDQIERLRANLRKKRAKADR
jgi:hypothetical protein